METSTTTKELTSALCQFQSAQLKATKKNDNPAFKTKYSGVNEVLEAVLPTLTEVGLCFVQFPDGEALTTRLMHVSGEWMQASYALKPVQNTPQASGSALTYARRYALLAVLGMGTEDDDGQAGSAPPPALSADTRVKLTAALHFHAIPEKKRAATLATLGNMTEAEGLAALRKVSISIRDFQAAAA